MQKQKRTRKFTKEHKELFMAIFAGTSDVNDQGKVVVNGKEWDWTDVDVQFFVRKSRQMKTDMSKFLEKELKDIFGNL